jgi:hypothetical protein
MALDGTQPFSLISEGRLKSEPGYQTGALELLKENNPGISEIFQSTAPTPSQRRLCFELLVREETIRLLQHEIQLRPSKYAKEEDYPLDNRAIPNAPEWVLRAMMELERLPHFFAEQMSAYEGGREVILNGEQVWIEDLGEILSWDFHHIVDGIVKSFVEHLLMSGSSQPSGANNQKYEPIKAAKPKGLSIKIQTPPGLKWEETTIEIVANDSVTIGMKEGPPRTYMYNVLGFLDRRKGNLPTRLWDLLLQFAEQKGEVGWSYAQDREKLETDVKRLGKLLQGLFHIEDRPFQLDKKSTSYKAKFSIRDRRHGGHGTK